MKNDKKQKIVALGCSWTDKYDSDVSPWPEVIQNKTGHKVYNYGYCGTGNKFSFDKFIMHIRHVGIPDKVYWLTSEYDRIDIINTKNENGVFAYKPVIQNAKLNFLEEVEKRWWQVNPSATKEDFDKWYIAASLDIEASKILRSSLDFQLVIDYNLDLLLKMQLLCAHYGIELKIMAALPPLQWHNIEELSEYDLSKMMLKSKIAKNLDLKNLIGWPFYKAANGINCHDISKWGKIYGITKDDTHPGQAGANLIADFFMDKKNILDYK